MERSLIFRFTVVAFVVAAIASAAPKTKTPRGKPDPSAPAFYPDEPACKVKSVEKLETDYENAVVSPTSGLIALTKPDKKNIYQLYVGRSVDSLECITCRQQDGGPRVDRNKPMVSWHPSGQWLVVGIQQDKHDNTWMPKSWQRGLLQSGIWLNIWITNPSGSQWRQVTDFKKSKQAPADGFVGVAFTPDGKRGVWAEIIDGNIFANAFGIWKLYIADFRIGRDGLPSFENKRDITPQGARWVEPGNFHPDGRRLLISADVGMKDAQGQDQYVLDVDSGRIQNITNTPKVWDEHGLYSPNGKKITMMSSYPFRAKKNSHKVMNLRAEFMLMDADGGRLQRLTHFNEPGYPESQPKKTIAAVAQFINDGSQMFAFVMSDGFGKTNWLITFEGRCGGSGGVDFRPR